MKAIVVREPGGLEQLSHEEVADPVPGTGEVRVLVQYAGLNRRDLYARMGQYPRVRFPAIPGSDGVGVVDAVGAGVDALAPGDPVIIYPALHWGDDEQAPGRAFEILGIPTNGTYAQQIVVPAANIFPKPGYLTGPEAAALPLVGLTAYRCLFTRGGLQAGESVLIPGIGGGLATMLLLMATAAGARVAVTSSQDGKLARARGMGAVAGANYRQPDYVKDLRQVASAGFDLIVDTLGGPGFEDLVALARPGGRVVLVGATAGPVPSLVLPRVFLKHLDLRGTSMGSPRDFARMLDFSLEHKIRPIVDRVFPLAEVRAAQAYLWEGGQFGKVVLQVSDPP